MPSDQNPGGANVRCFHDHVDFQLGELRSEQSLVIQSTLCHFPHIEQCERGRNIVKPL